MLTTKPTLVLVTGANQGIGFEAVKKLVLEHKNYQILMGGRRKDALEDAARQLKEIEPNANVEPLVLDLTSDESIAAAVHYINEKHGYLDVLINNAGISGSSARGPWPRTEWQEVFNTNVFGTSVLTESLLPLLAKSDKTKRIVFVTSELGSIERKFKPSNEFVLPYKVYAASKAALNMLSVNLAMQYSQDPTWKINLACPGHCATRFTDYAGPDSPANGALNICRLATMEVDGETGRMSNRFGTIPW
ncbi:unnamed protein product [Clonostachys rhizophaga]|uniref:Uncharacterized protein n=1 Tax=Clonostachys rhizophaga TaxID=160324 RepID=A0A9N9YGD5_9HYPO|nr:unnamed protein product [Clonostachys rhizophaga]